MNSQDAGIVGRRLATAALVAAIGISVGAACSGTSLLLKLFIT